MDKSSMNEYKIGIWYGIAAYTAWGFLPLYWKILYHVPAGEILAHRIVWSFVFVFLLIITTGKWKIFVNEWKNLFVHWKTGLSLLVASLFVTGNWFIYIWAINHGHVIESSLGYYINPLVSVLLGVFVLKEKLNFWQIVSFCLAGVGVLILTIKYGSFPWIALSLALTFALYGLAKKLIKLSAMFSLAFETMFVTPIALLFILTLQFKGVGSFGTITLTTILLLMGAGIATALPLLWFADAAKRIPLSMLGFLQYIAPTIMLVLGIALFHEHFTTLHFIGFLFIWIALLIFTFSKTKLLPRVQPKWKKSIGA